MSVGLVDLITQFRIQFFDHFPYVSSYVYSLNPVMTDKVPTMAVDRTGNMYWNPEWCEKLTLDQGAYVVQHETWHLILRHCHLSDEILPNNPSEQDLYDLNVAMDCVIWEMLECVKEHAPEGGVTLPNCQERWPEIKSGMTCLEIFSIIRQNRPKPPNQPPGQGESQDGEEESEGQEGQTNKSEDGDGESDGGQSGEQNTGSTGEGSDSEADDAGGGSDTGREDNQSGGSDGDRPTGSGADGQGEGVDSEIQDYGYDPEVVMGGGSAADGQPRDYEVSPNEAWDAYLEDNLLEQVEKAIETTENDRKWKESKGVIPGTLKATIKQKLHPQPDPWKRMAATIGLKVAGQMGGKEDTYQRRNRRQCCMQDGVILKGQKILTPDVVVIMDTSGSMTDACLNKCSVVCTQGCRAVGEYRLICWDARLRVDEMVRTNRTEWPRHGGGGTSMEEAIRYALSNYKPSVIILCTDGGTWYPEKEEMGQTQLIIALTQELDTPPWATRVRIPDIGKEE